MTSGSTSHKILGLNYLHLSFNKNCMVVIEVLAASPHLYIISHCLDDLSAGIIIL